MVSIEKAETDFIGLRCYQIYGLSLITVYTVRQGAYEDKSLLQEAIRNII